jgi:hypothetical protein
MRVFWHNGGLMIEPENKREEELLIELAGNLSFGKPSGMQNRIPSGDTPSGSEGLFERIGTDHETRPRGLTSKSNDKKHIVAIDKRL